MTLIKRLFAVFSRDSSTQLPVISTATLVPVSISPDSSVSNYAKPELFKASQQGSQPDPEPLPGWLVDEETLRDEGVLFGLSEARPDGKVAQIRAYFGQQSALLEEKVELYTENINELNLFIEQHENRIVAIREQLSDLRNSQPTPNNLVRHIVSLVLSTILCVGNFHLIDETLRPVFPNRWVAVGVFMAGMFNLFGRTSFFYETGTRLTGRRLVEELSLPLAASIFILVQAWQSQSVTQAAGLFVFVFFLFLLAGKLLLSTLTAIQTGLATIQANQQLAHKKRQYMPVWEAEIEQLHREIDAIRVKKWPIVTALNHVRAQQTRLNTQRDGLVNLFISEFELARSLRDRLTEQQRKSIMNYHL